MIVQDEHNHALYIKSQKEVDRLNHLLPNKNADMISLERKLAVEKLESSKWRHTAERLEMMKCR